MMIRNRLWNPAVVLQLLTLSTLTVSVGCGEEEVALAPVTGFVTDDGEPLVGAIVEFFPETGRTSVGQTTEGGAFTMKYGDEEGVVIGNCKVQITPGLAMPEAPEGEDVVAPPMKGPPQIVVVPNGVAVKDGEENSFVFELKDIRGKKRKS